MPEPNLRLEWAVKLELEERDQPEERESFINNLMETMTKNLNKG